MTARKNGWCSEQTYQNILIGSLVKSCLKNQHLPCAASTPDTAKRNSGLHMPENYLNKPEMCLRYA